MTQPERNECRREDLEALVRDELFPPQVNALMLHVASCADCRRELSWLRAEQALVQRRRQQQAELAPVLWQGVAARVAAAQRDRARGLERIPAALRPLAAAAAVLFGLFVVRGAGHLHFGKHAGLGGEPDEDGPRAHLTGQPPEPPAMPQPPAPPGPPSPPAPPQGRWGADAPDTLRAQVKVAGAPRVRLQTAAADVVVRIGAANEVALTVSDSPARQAALVLTPETGADADAPGGLVVARFDGRGALVSGDVELRVPPGAALDLSTHSGDLRIDGGLGALTLRTMTGEVRLGRVEREATLITTSGDIQISDGPGRLRVHTQSGMTRAALRPEVTPQVEFHSASGDLALRGRCAARCALKLVSASGELGLRLTRDSSFALGFASAGGEVRDHLGLTPGEGSGRPGAGAAGAAAAISLNARYRDGAGRIEARTASGDLQIEGE